jgi:predicted porin
MQKKLIALAIASALSAPAFADNANVTFYGKVDVDFESVSTDNPNGTNANVNPFTVTPASANPSRITRVATNASRLGIKGSEDIGGGLNAIYQYEVQMDANGNGGNGLGNGTRNSGVGLEGGFGKVVIGIWDTPYKLSHNKVELFDNTHFASATNLIGRSAATTTVNAGAPLPATGTTGTAAAQSFVTRLKQSVQYSSPNFGGFDVKVAYGTDMAPTGANAAGAGGVATNVAQDKRTLSVAATFEQEMFYVALANETATDAAINGTAKGNNSASRLVGAFKFGDAGFVGLTVEQMKITDAGAIANTVESHTRKGYELAGSYKIAEHRFGASYAKMGDLGTYADTGATQISLRYGYNFSKRTEAYAMYSKLTNKKYGQYNFSAGNTIVSSAGASMSGFGVGIAHSF